MVAAILLAPVFAVQVQKYTESLRERKGRKLRIFHTLMSTRAARVSPYHVEALNMIDIEFYGSRILGFTWRKPSEKFVLIAWKTYLDHLNTPFNKDHQDESKNWGTKGDELFTDLLYEMSRYLGYDFDKVYLKRSIYTPQAHFDQDQAQLIIRDSLVKILSGEQAIPMNVVSFPVSEKALAKEDEVQTRLIECLEGKAVLKVKIVGESPDKKT
jgi:hypothetical protein